MAYQEEISRNNPALFVFLLDQSGSMKDAWGDYSSSKAQGAADAVNRMLSNLVIRCSKGESVRDYFNISVIGYGSSEGHVGPALSGPLSGKDNVTISELANSPARVEDRVIKQPDGAGGIVDASVKFPVWFEPTAQKDTPMCGALRYARRVVSEWVGQHPNSFPPIAINITDGEATDGDPKEPAKDLRALGTSDGELLLFNCHISSLGGSKVFFPESVEQIPDEYGKRLFEMSSQLTPQMIAIAGKEGFAVGEHSRGFAFQADLVELVRFLDIGTRPKELR
ncbi:MAG TPA: vWA domain-containing protein [Anaerolineales bacterium]|nr:vWA domain-containing protein [Anaerolineales bacterium]